MSILVKRKLLSKPCFMVANGFFKFNQSNSLKTSAFNMIKLSECLNAEPTKAKKRIDPQVLLKQETRKRKKLEKEIRKFEKHGRKLKPIEEQEPDRKILKELESRKRPLIDNTKQETDDIYFLKKEWSNYISSQHALQLEQIDRALKSQEKALKELKKDNEELYIKAIQIDAQLIPFVRDGPSFTPPNKSYEPPEGDYQDVTFLYDRR